MPDIEDREVEELVYHQRIKLPYRYTAGEANTAFLDGLVEGEVRGSRCEHCELTLVPARPFCPSCSGHTDGIVAVATEGVVVAHTVEASGRVIGLVRLDGADSHLAHVLDVTPDDLVDGMRVRVRWADDPAAEITAIDRFEPVP